MAIGRRHTFCAGETVDGTSCKEKLGGKRTKDVLKATDEIVNLVVKENGDFEIEQLLKTLASSLLCSGHQHCSARHAEAFAQKIVQICTHNTRSRTGMIERGPADGHDGKLQATTDISTNQTSQSEEYDGRCLNSVVVALES